MKATFHRLVAGLALLTATLSGLLIGCRTTPPPPLYGDEVPPAEYGAPTEEELGQQGEEGGRFGYTGDETPDAPPAVNDLADAADEVKKEAEREVRDLRDVAESTIPEKPAPPKPTIPSASQMPYAIPVPGDPLVVTLPGVNSKLGKISIEKYDSSGNATGNPLPRGTQVQIPDPSSPGKKIFFKVP